MRKNADREQEREEFIIQNVTLGYHYISDLKLNIEPLGVVDLTHRDPDEIKGSQNLKNSLRAGYIRKISRETADASADRRAARMRKEVTKLQQSSIKTDTLDVDGKQLDVEPLNISRTDSAKMSEQVTTAGYANDPLSYAVALEIAEQQANSRGEDLSPEEFADMVSRDSGLVRRLITSNTNAIKSLATDGPDSRAYYAEPSDNGMPTIGSKRMKAPETMEGSDAAPGADAESIDLTKDL